MYVLAAARDLQIFEALLDLHETKDVRLCAWPAAVRATVEELFVAVGTRVTPRPPRRSEQAQFAHSAPTLSEQREIVPPAMDAAPAQSGDIDRRNRASAPMSAGAADCVAADFGSTGR